MPNFVTEGILAPTGVVILPLTVKMLHSIIKNYGKISKSYRIDFLDPSDNVLCEVTNMVTDDSLWDTLGKSRKQEDEYCIIANKNPDNFVTDITVQEKATSKMIQQKYSDKRFI